MEMKITTLRPPGWMLKRLSSRLAPSNGLTYPTKPEKENHRLKMAFVGGYVSSQEGINSMFSYVGCFISIYIYI